MINMSKKIPIAILFSAAKMPHAFEGAFDGKSAFDRALSWAENVPDSRQTVIFTDGQNRAAVEKAAASKKNISLVQNDAWTNGLIAKEIAAACKAHGADYAVYAWADCPFLSSALTAELIDTHTRYLAEYTFADGYPYGLAPEVVDAGAAGIIASLGETVQKAAGEKPCGRDALFSIMSGDINSFEVETVISPKDYRMLRLDFSCADKISFLACKNLFSAAGGKINLSSAAFDAVFLSDLAEGDVSVLRTVPAFYNVQIAGRYQHALVYSPYHLLFKNHPLSDMPLSAFKKIVSQIAGFSEKAVVSLSAFGEPLLHPDFVACVKEVLSHPDLTVLIETDGTLVTQELAAELASYGAGRIIWVVLLDAMESKLYSQIHQCAEQDFSMAVNAVSVLESFFPHNVYPQMTRMKANEAQLEPFYRYWKDTNNASAGDLIVQKYNRFCASLPDEKSADLSPLVRNPCWHLRRDMTILSDGTVPLCVCACGALHPSVIVGNVLSERETVESVWGKMAERLSAHLKEDYPEQCRACDEYYTFNF